MATVMQKIKDIEDEMARTQKNKATAHHLGLLKDHELEDDKFHSNSQEFVEFSTLRKQIPNTAFLRDY